MTIVRTLLLLALLATGPAWAETLSVPTGDPAAALERPKRGSSMSTVQSHVRNIYGKLGVHNKTEAVFEARQLGLLG